MQHVEVELEKQLALFFLNETLKLCYVGSEVVPFDILGGGL